MNAVNPAHSPTPSNAAEPSMEEILASIRRIIADDTSLRPIEAADQDAGHAVHHGEIAVVPDGQDPQAAAIEPSPHAPHPQVAAPREPELPPHEPVEPASADAPHEMPVATALPEGHGEIAAPQFPSPEGPMAEPIAELPRHPLAPPEVAEQDPAELEPEPAPVLPGSHDDLAAAGAPAAAEPPPAPEPLFAAATGASVKSAFNALAASRLVANSEQLTGLVREMIRPLVKEWIDANLPGMIERMIVAEIERMGRDGR